MAFSRMAFSPADGLNNTAYYPTTPVSEADARAQVQSVSDQLKAYINNTLLAEMERTLAGQSGAERIGSAAIANVSGQTVRAQIADVKRQMDEASMGSVSDGMISTAKLAGGAVTKPKMHPDALDWTLVADSGVLSASGSFTIAAQTGKSEMLVQLRNDTGTVVSGMFVAPLDANGMIVPACQRVISFNPADFSVDYRTITMASATTVVYGLSRAHSVDGVTNLQRVYLFVR
jgi:hypothetical protein